MYEPWVGKFLLSLAYLFFAVLFVQSGMDKVADRKGNLEWMVPHFEKSPFAGMVPMLLSMLTAMELTTGFLCLMALIPVWFSTAFILSSLAVLAVMFTLLCLFAGQRFAKDYVGAQTIATYFGVALLLALFTAGMQSPVG